MRSWVRGVYRSLSGVPRPTDDPRAHASGTDADRILLFGGGTAVGWGVLSHDMALPGSLARAVSNLTGRGTDVDVVADAEIRAAHAVRALDGVNLGRYDAIVLTLGLNETVSLASVAAWRRDMDALLAYLAGAASARTPIFIVGIHSLTQITRYDRIVAPVVAHHRKSLNRVSTALAAHRERVTFIPFDPAPRVQQNRYRTSAEYRDGGMYLATRIAPVLDDALDTAGVGRRPRNVALDIMARRNALEAIWALDSSSDHAMDRLTEFARRSFHTPIAKVTIVEGDRYWTKSAQGEPRTAGPRSDSICFTAVEHEDSLVVGEASLDPRFAEMPHVKGPPLVRFYAGHRIEAPNGIPIGVLSVEDTVPRDVHEFDRALLRDIALLVQKEVWLLSRADGAVGRRPQRAAVPVERTFAPTSFSR